jgi:hypothetical protein
VALIPVFNMTTEHGIKRCHNILVAKKLLIVVELAQGTGDVKGLHFVNTMRIKETDGVPN